MQFYDFLGFAKGRRKARETATVVHHKRMLNPGLLGGKWGVPLGLKAGRRGVKQGKNWGYSGLRLAIASQKPLIATKMPVLRYSYHSFTIVLHPTDEIFSANSGSCNGTSTPNAEAFFSILALYLSQTQRFATAHFSTPKTTFTPNAGHFYPQSRPSGRRTAPLCRALLPPTQGPFCPLEAALHERSRGERKALFYCHIQKKAYLCTFF